MEYDSFPRFILKTHPPEKPTPIKIIFITKRRSPLLHHVLFEDLMEILGIEPGIIWMPNICSAPELQPFA